MSWNRRRILQVVGGTGVAALAGCSGSDGPEQEGTGTAQPTSSDQTGSVASPPTSQQAKLAAADGDSADGFGGSVAVTADGKTALIGASGEEEPNGQSAGAAYVFTRSDGEWTQEAKLAADDGAENDLFGIAVALADDGSTALIGADLADPAGPGSGAAYVFSRSGGDWNQTAKLVAADGDDNDKFGRAVALSGNGTTALVGAYGDEDPNGENRFEEGAGSAYVFSQGDSTWTREAKLAADDGSGGDGFGWSVALANDNSTALVGCVYRDTVYIFTRSSGSWAQQATVATDGRDERTGFGGSLAVDDEGTTAFIGAFVDGEPNGEKAGAAYVYADEGGSWSQQAKVAADDGDENDQFADSVALSSDGQVALAGAGNDADPNGTAAGSAYVFTPTGDTWEQASKLTADDGDTRDGFGTVLTLASDTGTAVIGALGDEDPNGEGELSGGGSAYVFD